MNIEKANNQAKYNKHKTKYQVLEQLPNSLGYFFRGFYTPRDAKIIKLQCFFKVIQLTRLENRRRQFSRFEQILGYLQSSYLQGANTRKDGKKLLLQKQNVLSSNSLEQGLNWPVYVTNLMATKQLETTNIQMSRRKDCHACQKLYTDRGQMIFTLLGRSINHWNTQGCVSLGISSVQELK